MLILANQFRLGSKLGRQAKSGVLGLYVEYLMIFSIFAESYTCEKHLAMTTQNLGPGQLRPCSEIRINRFEGRDEGQTAIIFAPLNRDSHIRQKLTFSVVYPDTTKRLSDSSTGNRIRKPPDHQDHLPMQ
jgi:hypothetical protein